MLKILKYSASYGILCKFNVYQQPRQRLHACSYHSSSGNPILLLTVLALGPLTSSKTTSLELSFPLFLKIPHLELPHLHSLPLCLIPSCIEYLL